VLQKIFEREGFHWLDIVDPTQEELDQIAQNYSVTALAIQDCLEPEHLPKIEKYDESTFIIVRAFGDKAFEDPTADTVQDLTRKVAVFYSPKFLITIHRKEMSCLSAVKEKWTKSRAHPKDIHLYILVDLLTEVIWSYEPALEKAENFIDDFETKIFKRQAQPDLIEELYFLKRKISIIKKMLRRILDVSHKLELTTKHTEQLIQSLREDGDRLFFFSDQLMESIDNLLSVNISLGTQHTNDTVRVLTLFSVYFMPLTFIVGVYGMNFKYMPELEEKWGYPAVLIFMAIVTLSIYFWFRRKGWMK